MNEHWLEQTQNLSHDSIFDLVAGMHWLVEIAHTGDMPTTFCCNCGVIEYEKEAFRAHVTAELVAERLNPEPEPEDFFARIARLGS